MDQDAELAAQIARECSHDDIEIAHARADQLVIEKLRELGFVKTADAWEAVDKWYA